MGFAEIKKSVNTDLNTPLNHLSWLNDYKVFGNASYVFRNKAILNELYHSYTIVMNDESIYTEAFDAIAVEGSNVGKALAAINGIDSAETLKTLSAMNAVANSETAMNAVLNSETAMNAVLNSETAMNAVANSETAMNAVANSETAMNAVLNSETAMNAVTASEKAMNNIVKSTLGWNAKKPFFMKVNEVVDYAKNVFDVLQDTTLFQYVVSDAQDGTSSLNQYCTESYATKNGIIACALGCWNQNSSYGTRLSINGDIIKELTYPNCPIQPKSVTSDNVNAIAIPTATFSDISDGYAAIKVYKAI